MSKITVADSPHYTIYYDEHHGLTFIHCEVKTTWTKTIKQQLLKEFNILKTLRGSPLYAIHEIGDNTHLKFLKLFGFTFVQDVIGTDGVNRQVYVTGNNYGY